MGWVSWRRWITRRKSETYGNAKNKSNSVYQTTGEDKKKRQNLFCYSNLGGGKLGAWRIFVQYVTVSDFLLCVFHLLIPIMVQGFGVSWIWLALSFPCIFSSMMAFPVSLLYEIELL